MVALASFLGLAVAVLVADLVRTKREVAYWQHAAEHAQRALRERSS